ncbi:MAG: molybdopterin-dependent oxidoreductase, partial [Thermodesulfobacteriota bacterium]
MDRRDFLKMLGLGGLGAAIGAGVGLSNKPPGAKLIPYVIPPEDVVPGVATWYASLCTQCSAGCGIHVKVQEGRAKKIEGNPNHPVSRGKLCALGQAGLQTLYNPDRIKAPMKRRGARGSGDYVEITWEEAFSSLSNNLAGLQGEGNSKGLYSLTTPLRGHLNTLIKSFMRGFGSSNYFHYEPFGLENLMSANGETLGVARIPNYDIANTKLLLSFGADFASTWLSPVNLSNSYGHMRQGRPGVRGRFVQVEPRMSLSGANADEWVPARPGTEGVLALAMANVIVNSGLYKGADSAQWKSLLRGYSPKKISAIAEVDESSIKRLAKEFALAKPSLAIGGELLSSYDNGADALNAVNVLNHVAGNIGVKGGVQANPSAIYSDRKGPAVKTKLTELIRAADKKRVKTLIMYNANPLFATPEAMGTKAALSKIPYIASLSSFMDDTTAMADLILPVHTYLEDWGDDFARMGAGSSVATIMQPAVSPIYNTKSAGDIFLDLARGVGGLDGSLKDKSFKDYLRGSWKGIHGGGPGFNKFWNNLLRDGGMWKKGRSGKRIGPVTVAKVKGRIPKGPSNFAGSESEYPFYLTLHQSMHHDGRGANLPWMQELPDPMTSVVWGTWVEMNPKTAKGLGIKEGDMVKVESPGGSMDAPVYLYPGIRPDTISIPIGQGHSHYGRYAKNRGTNPIKILPFKENRKS